MNSRLRQVVHLAYMAFEYRRFGGYGLLVSGLWLSRLGLGFCVSLSGY